MTCLAKMPAFPEDRLLPVLIGGGFAIVVLALMFAIVARYTSLWLQSYLARGNISMHRLLLISLRKVNPRVIVRSKIMAVQAGLVTEQQVTTNALESHYLAGGDVIKVITAMIAAQRAGVQLSFQEATALDLAGKDLQAVVRSGMMPGQVTTAETVIHPAGSVLVEGKSVKAISLEDAIDAGQNVEIVAARDDIVVVRPSTDA